MADAPKQKRVNIEIPKDLDATYSNFAIISHSPNEVIIDFAQLLPAMPKARVQARVLLTPLNARMLYNALGQNLAKYERRFGQIQTGSRQSGSFDPKAGTLGGMQWSVGGDEEDSESDGNDE